MRVVAILVAFVLPLAAQYSAASRPRFEDFPAGEVFQGPNAPVQLRISSERLFKTRLTEASREPPNFAGHLRFVSWGCGQYCGAGGLVDLKSGRISQPPHASGSVGWDRWIFKGGSFSYPFPTFKYRDDSRLFILQVGRPGGKPSTDALPDTYYYVWDDNRFRLLLHVPADESAVPSPQK